MATWNCDNARSSDGSTLAIGPPIIEALHEPWVCRADIPVCRFGRLSSRPKQKHGTGAAFIYGILCFDFLFFHHDFNRALRVGDWKLVSRRPETNHYALYNLATDRSEQNDLAAKEP